MPEPTASARRRRRRTPRPLPLFLCLPLAFLAPSSVGAQDAGGPGTRAAEEPSIIGFTPRAAERQRELEGRYDALLDARDLRSWMERMSARPNHVGSPHMRENAEWALERFRSWGFEARIDTFHVLFPTPTARRLEMVAPRPFTAGLREPEVEGDASSRIRRDRLPPYNAYSADGDVTAELVYVNYGIPEDYEELARRGIDVAGKIVIARYGRSWRGIKPKVAAEHGAVGCILYSDPRDDGYFRGDVYPEGPFRMEHGVQRGSVADMPRFPGDPLTPGVPATRDAERLSLEEAPTLMRIPVLPISYADARPLLEALEGPVAPDSWRGALPITYHVGPGPARVRLEVAFSWDTVPAYDVVAVLRGAEAPDEWIVRGNHMDAWVFGAADPLSGMVALMAEAQAVGALAREGWRPRRTLVYAGWDAEEPGLLGSTEWAEANAEELRRRAVAYVNTDGSGRGFLGAGGSHILERLVGEVARDVEDPQTGVSVARRLRARRAADGDVGALEEELRISPLGSGSDYTPFLQHLGLPSLHLGYGGENEGGSYHSAFDTFEHYVRFGDPGFRYGVALAQTAGRVTLRLSEAPVLPYRFGNFAHHVGEYVDELEALADSLREATDSRNRLAAADAHALAADPTETYVPPARETRVPHLSFAALRNAAERLAAAAAAYDSSLAATMATGGVPEASRAALNDILLSVERRMTREEGLPGRPWFRHQVYAPGYYTGYGVKTLPAVREALEQREWEAVPGHVETVAGTLEGVAAAIEEATGMLPEG